MSVVNDQAAKFGSDPIITELSKQEGAKLCYAGCPYAKDQERRQSFIRACTAKRLPIALISNGLNFELSVEDVRVAEQDIHFDSRFILNGVCVQFRGHIDKHSLLGCGRVILDNNQAELERRKAHTFFSDIIVKRVAVLQKCILN